MILDLMTFTPSGSCIPRESGDDPMITEPFNKLKEYSPRERG